MWHISAKMDAFRWNLRENVGGNLAESPKREGRNRGAEKGEFRGKE